MRLAPWELHPEARSTLGFWTAFNASEMPLWSGRHAAPRKQHMPRWPATKARRVLAALLRIGWRIKRQSGSHRTLERVGWPNLVFAFHDDEELGPRMMARVARQSGLSPKDL